METTSQGLTIEKLLKAKALLDAAEVPTNDRFLVLRQIRLPRSKKKRIRRKWAKRIENHDTSFLEGGLCQH
jgi:hypothetical protein